MPYGIVACPSCRKAKAFEVGVESTACPLCGRRLDVSRLVTVVAPDAAALARMIGEANARLAGATAEEASSLASPARERSPPTDAVAAAVRAARAVASEADRADAAAGALSGFSGSFTEEDLADALEAVGVPRAKAGQHLRRMLSARAVYEPRPGSFRTL